MRANLWLPALWPRGVACFSVSRGVFPTGSVSLQLQLAHILHLTDVWSDHTDLRMVRVGVCVCVPAACVGCTVLCCAVLSGGCAVDVTGCHMGCLVQMVAVEKESEVKARRAEVEETLLSMRIDVDVWVRCASCPGPCPHDTRVSHDSRGAVLATRSYRCSACERSRSLRSCRAVASWALLLWPTYRW